MTGILLITLNETYSVRLSYIFESCFIRGRVWNLWIEQWASGSRSLHIRVLLMCEYRHSLRAQLRIEVRTDVS